MKKDDASFLNWRLSLYITTNSLSNFTIPLSTSRIELLILPSLNWNFVYAVLRIKFDLISEDHHSLLASVQPLSNNEAAVEHSAFYSRQMAESKQQDRIKQA